MKFDWLRSFPNGIKMCRCDVRVRRKKKRKSKGFNVVFRRYSCISNIINKILILMQDFFPLGISRIFSWGISCKTLQLSRWIGVFWDVLMGLFITPQTYSIREWSADLVVQESVRQARRQSVEIVAMCGYYPALPPWKEEHNRT